MDDDQNDDHSHNTINNTRFLADEDGEAYDYLALNRVWIVRLFVSFDPFLLPI